ncbi:hypothetical protein ACQCSU_01495 [Pseudarthrobacter sp. O4]
MAVAEELAGDGADQGFELKLSGGAPVLAYSGLSGPSDATCAPIQAKGFL